MILTKAATSQLSLECIAAHAVVRMVSNMGIFTEVRFPSLLLGIKVRWLYLLLCERFDGV